LGGGLNSILRDLKLLPRYYKDVRAIARRMFVTNAFDGILASLGVSVGGFSSKANPELLALSIIGGGLAMGLFSSVVGVYISERAERLRELRELERSMAKRLDGTIYARLAKLIPLYVALWSGLGATTFPLAVAFPYLVSGSTRSR
jgi:predicted membrane protein (TIGR00267 family)